MANNTVKPNILIVDDDQAYRETIARALSRYQVTVFMAVDYTEACRLLGTETFSIVIFDFSVTGDNNESLCHKIMELPDRITMIILSRQQSSQIEKTIRACSPVVYFVKPVVINDLCAVVGRCLDGLRQK